MHSLSQDEKSKIHAVYVAVYNLPFKTQQKSTLLTTLMGGADWSWRVTGITVGALEALAANDYRYVKGKVCRAHLVARIDTARAVFEIPQPLPEDQFFTRIWKNDKTVIATKSENKTGGTLPKALPIDSNLGMFTCNPLVGFKCGKKEADFLRNLHKAYKAGVVAVKESVPEL
jgi:hypothetical protein